MKILALDVSSISTGVCVFNNGKLIKSSCELIKPPPRKTYGERLNTFEKALRGIIAKHSPDYVVLEDIFRSRNIKTFKVLAMWRGVAINTVYDTLGLDCIGLMASEARALIEVKNDKLVVFNHIVKKYKLKDYDFDTHNDLTDAIALGLAGIKVVSENIDVESLRKSKKKKRKRKSKKKSKVK